MIVKHINASRFGTQSLRSLGPKIWNNLPPNIKSETSFLRFKEYIKTWHGPNCRCKVCKCINMWTYIYSSLYFLNILVRIWSVFMHCLHFFIFVYMQIYFFRRINKAFILSFSLSWDLLEASALNHSVK